MINSQAPPGKRMKVQRDQHMKNWQINSEQARTKIGMPFSAKPWTSSRRFQNSKFQGDGSHSDILDVYFYKMQKEAAERGNADEDLDMWADYSQSVNRFACRAGGPPAIMTSTMLYSFRHDITYSKSSHLRMLGWPKVMMGSDFKNTEVNSLAADGWSLPVCASVAAACWCNPFAPWWKRTD